ncbi:MAG TPA: helix-turn-helix transcriptional regulator [Gemmatimonadaceae bacterium]|nr:helix-turn-helix transcriptional regulator [Gemmatimonadaceae bacterium]
MDRQRPAESYLPLRPVEFHVLLSLAAGERHGYGMLQDAESRGERIDVGTLYRALARMVDQLLIAPAGNDPSDERRNNYRITPLGLEVARAEAARMAALTRAARAGGLLGAIAT